jgi:hypothetical protein
MSCNPVALFSAFSCRFWPFEAKKIHSFHKWRVRGAERRCQSPERSGAAKAGAEASTDAFGLCPRGAAQAKLNVKLSVMWSWHVKAL